MKLAIVVVCTLCVAYVRAQGGSMAEMMLMSSLLGRQGTASGGSNPLTGLGSSSSSSNPLAALAGGSSTTGSSNPLAALAGGASSTNPMSSMMGRGMGGMASGMMLGGAEMSSLMDFYMCGSMRVPMQYCFMMMQQNM